MSAWMYKVKDDEFYAINGVPHDCPYFVVTTNIALGEGFYDITDLEGTYWRTFNVSQVMNYLSYRASLSGGEFTNAVMSAREKLAITRYAYDHDYQHWYALWCNMKWAHPGYYGFGGTLLERVTYNTLELNVAELEAERRMA